MADGCPLVLVADDDPDTRVLLQRALLRRGFEVEVVQDGQALIDRLRVGPKPDAIVTDLDMPRLSGLEALPELVATGLPVIVVSALNPKLNLNSLSNSGVTAVLLKPLRPRELVGLLKRVLKLDAA